MDALFSLSVILANCLLSWTCHCTPQCPERSSLIREVPATTCLTVPLSWIK